MTDKQQTDMTASEILRKHEDANEMHFHEVDRKFIIEAMEEYARYKCENMPMTIHKGITNTHVYIEDGRIHVKPNNEKP